ncbi:hypothetical protein U1Q18_008426 [Sarracenia purpurea var. burkii]
MNIFVSETSECFIGVVGSRVVQVRLLRESLYLSQSPSPMVLLLDSGIAGLMAVFLTRASFAAASILVRGRIVFWHVMSTL